MNKKKIISMLTIIVLLMSTVVPSYAAITTIVASDEGINYEYDIKALNDSYLEYQINPDSPGALLYKNFMNKKPTAFYDDVQGYIDAADVDNAYLEAQMNDEEFNTDNYTETKAAKADENAVTNLQTVKLGEDGQIVTEPKEPAAELKVVKVSAINDGKAIEVEFGTPVEELELPEEVEVTLSNEETDVANVEWNTENYDPELEGEQEIEGTLVVPEGKEWTIPEELLAVTVKVIVGEDTRVEVKEVKTTVGNDNTVIVTFVEGTEVTEEDLVDTTIVLTAGETSLTATYVPNSFAEGKANFVLSGEDKLVDATTYTVSADWATFAEETVEARIGEEYAKTFEKVTTDVIAGKFANVYFAAKNQYGEDFALTVANSDVSVTAKLNGIPLTVGGAKEVQYTDGNDFVKINKDLVEGNKLDITVTNTVGEEKYSNTFNYTVIEGEIAVETTIGNLTAKYTGTPANDHEIGKPADEVMPDDVVELTVEVKDQYNNPVATPDVRWVVEAADGVITKSDGGAIDVVTDDEETFTFKAAKAGDVKITAYIGNGEYVVYEATIGAKKLETMSKSEFTAPINKEAATSKAKIAINAGAVLKAEDVKFEVTSFPEGATKEDIALEAVYGEEEGNKDDVFVKATTQVAGEYKFKAYVGDAVDAEGAVVAEESTITTTLNPAIDSFTVEAFEENELTNNSTINKVVTFKNKHGEKIVPAADKLAVTVAPATGLAVVSKTVDGEVVLEFKATTVGDYVVTLVANGKVQQLNVEVVAASKLAKINVADKVEVINKDAAADVILLPISFEDQYGNAMEVKITDLNEASGAGYTVTYYDKDKKAAGTNAIAFVGINTNLEELPTEAKAIEISSGADDAKVAATINVTVLAERAAKTVNYKKELPAKMVIGNEFAVVIGDFEAIDQYGDKFDISGYTLEVKAEDGKDFVTVESNKITAAKPGTQKVTITIKTGATEVFKKEAAITVSAADEIATLAIDPVGTLNVKADSDTVKEPYNTAELVFTAKDADGNVISMPAKDLTWTTSDKTVATVENGVVTAVKKGTAAITAIAANGVSATVEVTVVDEEIVATTIVFAEKVPTEVKVGAKIDVLDGLKVYDQNGVQIVKAELLTATVTSANTAIAVIDANEVKGVAEGTVTIRVMVGNAFATIKVTVVPAP